MQIDTLDYYEDLSQAFNAGVKSAGEMHGDHGIEADWLTFLGTMIKTRKASLIDELTTMEHDPS